MVIFSGNLVVSDNWSYDKSIQTTKETICNLKEKWKASYNFSSHENPKRRSRPLDFLAEIDKYSFAVWGALWENVWIWFIDDIVTFVNVY